MSILSLVLAATEEAAEKPEINPYIYGATGLVVLLALLFLVTRLNIDR